MYTTKNLKPSLFKFSFFLTLPSRDSHTLTQLQTLCHSGNLLTSTSFYTSILRALPPKMAKNTVTTASSKTAKPAVPRTTAARTRPATATTATATTKVTASAAPKTDTAVSTRPITHADIRREKSQARSRTNSISRNEQARRNPGRPTDYNPREDAVALGKGRNALQPEDGSIDAEAERLSQSVKQVMDQLNLATAIPEDLDTDYMNEEEHEWASELLNKVLRRCMAPK